MRTTSHPPPAEAIFSVASAGDVERAVPLIREFYQHFAFAWEEPRKRAVLQELVCQPTLGRLWLAEIEGRPAGYALVLHLLSLEFEGRVALLDEFWVTQNQRGAGLGRRFLDHLAQDARVAGFRALRLELDEAHPAAARLYARAGFQRDGRDLWTRRIEPPPTTSTA